jgi:hypothetical protein
VQDPVGEFVERALVRGVGLGFEEFSDLAAFVALIPINVRFSEAGSTAAYLSWARPIVERANADGGSKLALIEHELRRASSQDERASIMLKLLAEMKEVA